MAFSLYCVEICAIFRLYLTELYGPEYFETRLGWLARNLKSVSSYITDPTCDTGAVVRYGGTLFYDMALAWAQIELGFLWA